MGGGMKRKGLDFSISFFFSFYGANLIFVNSFDRKTLALAAEFDDLYGPLRNRKN